MNSHPYQSAPKSSFWSRAVSRDWDASAVVRCGSPDPLICKGEKVVSAGSCFASNIIPYLEQAGLTYLRTEVRHPAFRDLEPEALGYENFSAAYGNIYTARQLLQLLKRCCDRFTPAEDRWKIGEEIYDPLRPGLRYRARSDREFDLLTAQHLRRSHAAFEQADVFIFTLGLTEAWVSRLDGTVFPACPGTVAGSFDPERHEFKNFSAAEIVDDLSEAIELLRQINPAVRIILTVSPVPLVATATDNHVLSATVYSKAVLRVAAEEVSRSTSDVTYFPAFEIITGPQAPFEFFEADRRSVSQAGIDAVMRALLARCEADDLLQAGADRAATANGDRAKSSAGVAAVDAAELSRMIAKAECEEAMADPSLTSRNGGGPSRRASVQNGSGKQPGAFPAQTPELPRDAAPNRARDNAPVDELRRRIADLDASLTRVREERDYLEAAAARWFEAAIATTHDHNPFTAPARHVREGWWLNVARRLYPARRRGFSPLTLGDRACSAQQWELAVRYYRDALDLNPKEPTTWLKCAYALRAAGKAPEAEVVFGKAFEYLGLPPALVAFHAARPAISALSPNGFNAVEPPALPQADR